MSLAIVAAAAAVIIGGTTAFFSDTETSRDNILTAGAIDLGVDNHSYYNGVLSTSTTWRIDYDIDPVLGDNPETEGIETDYVLEAGRLFFNFNDLKPGDWGEDTISLHVNNNDSWLCADVTLTSNDEHDLVEPEADDGDDTTGTTGGELAQHVNFFWWADDGDNVFESDETLLPAGPMGNLDVGQTATVALADSQTNLWGDQGPLPGDQVRYLAKAWCFGNATMTPYAQDGGNQGAGPDVRPVLCDGSQENNVTQTDSFTADISFRAVQSRHNLGFLCRVPDETPVTRLTLAKTVLPALLHPDSAYTLTATGPSVISGVEGAPAVTTATVLPGVYTLSETDGGFPGALVTWQCIGNATAEVNNGDGTATVTVAAGESVGCDVTNMYEQAPPPGL